MRTDIFKRALVRDTLEPYVGRVAAIDYWNLLTDPSNKSVLLIPISHPTSQFVFLRHVESPELIYETGGELLSFHLPEGLCLILNSEAEMLNDNFRAMRLLEHVYGPEADFTKTARGPAYLMQRSTLEALQAASDR